MERARAVHLLLDSLPSTVSVSNAKPVWITSKGTRLQEVLDDVPINSPHVRAIRIFLTGSANAFKDLHDWSSVTSHIVKQEPDIQIQPFAVERTGSVAPHPEPHRGVGYSLVLWSKNPRLARREWDIIRAHFSEFGIKVKH